jgi:hypothetical protein
VFSFSSFSYFFFFIGATSETYKKSYFFFEKLRVLRGDPKTAQRISAEKAAPVAVVSRETSEGKKSTESYSHNQTGGETFMNTSSRSNIPKEVTKETQYDEDNDEIEIIDDDSEEEEDDDDENDLGESQEEEEEDTKKRRITPSKPKETKKRRRSTPKITYNPKKTNKRVKTSPSNKEPNHEDDEDSVVAPMKFEPGASIAQVANHYRTKATQEANDRYIWRFVQREFTEGTFIGVIAEFKYPFFTVKREIFLLSNFVLIIFTYFR